MNIYFNALSKHVETVILVSQHKPKDRIEVDLDELDATSVESKATYADIITLIQWFFEGV